MKFRFSNLEDLIKKRKEWLKSSKENQFDFDSILSGLYADPSHFIYELLQNAEDEGAKEIRFELFEDRLDVYHNGKVFDLKDIDGVTGIGISKKKEDLNFIGKFGVGFKSIFAITQTPQIFSGEYAIEVENFVIPTPIDDNSIRLKNNETLIRIPFNHKYRSQKNILKLISDRLENLELRIMLFLKNIEEIKIEFKLKHNALSRRYSRKVVNDFKGFLNTKKLKLESSKGVEKYLVFEKPIKIEGRKLWVEVAYKLDKGLKGKEIIVSEPNSKLVVFFPTEKVTFLNFIIQGPFKTTPNRENIPLEDKQNKLILNEIGNLIADSLVVVKNLGYLDVNFLSILPIESDLAENEEIYSVIYEKVKEKFLSEKLLPTSDGTYTKAEVSLLARGKELTEFLDNSDIQKLFSKQNWLDTNITYDKTRELRDYLTNELNVPEVDFESFARKITVEFLKKKSDKWMIKFYSRLLGQQSLWSEGWNQKGILRSKPIIRLENNEHIAPFDNNGKIQVYLPGDNKSEYKTVKTTLTKNEKSLRFLKELGLTKPDLFAEIREFILPRYQKVKPIKNKKQYFNDFGKILRGYESIPSNKKEEFINELSDTPFIYAVKNDNSNQCKSLEAYQTYFPYKDLKNYFNGYHTVYFVNDELFQKFGRERLTKFLKELGVEDVPSRIEIEDNLSWEEKSKLRGNNGYTYDIHLKDYDLEGLENFLKNITLERSCLLWRLLLKSIENLSGWYVQEFFEGEYRWFYRRECFNRFDAKFLKTLKQRAWLYDKNNNLKKPSKITFSNLSDNYKKKSPNIDDFKEVLGFQPEIIEHLPEDYRKKLEIVKDIPLEELEKLFSEKKESLEKEEQWTPQSRPDTVPIVMQEVEPNKIITTDLSGQVENEVRREKINKVVDKSKKEFKQISIDKKEIGKWGEKYVYNALKQKYQEQGDVIETDSGFKVIDANGEEFEIIWLNKYQDKGKGYDFVIRINEVETEYIEVKTKTQEGKELVEVTGVQWEFARKLFEEGKGEKYSFYIVFNAGKENAKILILRNPIKLWKEGKLYAHPVNFKL